MLVPGVESLPAHVEDLGGVQAPRYSVAQTRTIAVGGAFRERSSTWALSLSLCFSNKLKQQGPG